ncbi:MAG: InlB B-repeat-containing protein [Mycoplasmoidaceae bacterium]
MNKLLITSVLPIASLPFISMVGCGNQPIVKYHTITFHTNEAEEDIPVQTVLVDNLPIEPKVPIKAGFNFLGWYLDDETFAQPFNWNQKLTKDVDLFASWMDEGFDYAVELKSDGMLELDNRGGQRESGDYIGKITLNTQYARTHTLPEDKAYYSVIVGGDKYTNFILEKISSSVDYYMKLTIPNGDLPVTKGSRISIEVKPYGKYLTFETNKKGATLGYEKHNLTTDIDIEICYNIDASIPTWSDWDGSWIALQPNQPVYVRNTKDVLSTDEGYFNFIFNTSDSNLVNVTGNVMSMINFSSLTPHCFNNLFWDSQISSVPTLPSTTLAKNCYSGMFGWSDVETTPILPALTLVPNCYQSMFYRCDNLSSVAALAFNHLDEKSCLQMFNECRKLKINDGGPGTPFLTCPNYEAFRAVYAMFANTGGDYTADPVPGHTYYWYE